MKYQQVAQALEKEAKAQGFSKKQWADAAGISRNRLHDALNRLRAGKETQLGTINRIAKPLGLRYLAVITEVPMLP